MRLRLTKIDDYQLLTCVKHRVWGSKFSRFKDWQVGDYLGIIVDKSLAALGEVTGPPYVSKERVWDNGLFPHRIPIEFRHFLLPENRPPILGQVRDALTSAWGLTWGWGVINQSVLEGEAAETIVETIRSRPDRLPDVLSNLEAFLAEARARRDALAKAKTPARVSRVPARAMAGERLHEPPQDESAHTRAQYGLIQLGRITGCSVWIASNDRNRQYKGKTLGDGCLKALPNLGLSKEATDRIRLIDVIWIRQSAPVCAFEVETTTSVYSGLLRMSDLLALVPALNIKLFVVAPRERQGRVMEELSRPTFQKIGLSEFCRFVSTEALDGLLSKVEGLSGHVQPTIIETVAIGLEEPVAADLN